MTAYDAVILKISGAAIDNNFVTAILPLLMEMSRYTTTKASLSSAWTNKTQLHSLDMSLSLTIMWYIRLKWDTNLFNVQTYCLPTGNKSGYNQIASMWKKIFTVSLGGVSKVLIGS